MLGPDGYELVHWKVGCELDQESYEGFYDRETAAIYAMCVMKEGMPETFLLARQKWIELKKQLDGIG